MVADERATGRVLCEDVPASFFDRRASLDARLESLKVQHFCVVTIITVATNVLLCILFVLFVNLQRPLARTFAACSTARMPRLFPTTFRWMASQYMR